MLQPVRIIAVSVAAVALTGSVYAATSSASPGSRPAPRAAHPTVDANAVAAPAKAEACAYTKVKPISKWVGLPDYTPAKAARPYTARLRTTQGTIAFEALTDKAPCTTYSFRFLAERGFFDRTHCHRSTTQRIFVLQCGDPTGTGSGAPGYQFPDENLAGATYPAGTVAMANAGPNTNGSQFFFTWKDTKLSPAYTPFGRITQGLDVLRRIGEAGNDEQNNPGDGYPTRYTEFHKIQISHR
ncbi:peptidylprolyl isomerase [Actinomadura rupiterrae]|uniref:peptidylprolyl isomerase n=1 Tax=Actinomadura rupiterrae TaxID=559627 RepID=UPI0020A4FA67|nr:peptidylprolyl isomerase [Actinomadura rupiterrae]MCP2341367.1 peptidyl-prolyl cis-trans isomerase B (cyclophilin B) [Actinomadura rupiterrae]